MRPFIAGTVLALCVTGAGIAPGVASATTKPPTFKNCTALHKHYPHGVAKPGAVNKGGKVTGAPIYNAKLYAANKSLDRDKDGIACEK